MSSHPLDKAIDAVQDFWKTTGSDYTVIILTILVFAPIIPLVILFVLASIEREKPLPPPVGCRKCGLQGRSNLSDQYSKQYAKGAGPGPDNRWSVKALFIYPIKSCAPVELDKTEIIRTGLRYDRQFTIAQQVTSLPTLEGKVTSKWTFITQRTFPRLAKVQTEVWVPDPSAPGYREDGEWVKSEGCLIVRFPFAPDVDFSMDGLRNYSKILAAKVFDRTELMAEFRVPFNPTKDRMKEMKYRSEEVKIWNDMPVALNMGVEIPYETIAKLKYSLGVTNPITLFRIDTTKYREVSMCAPKKEDVGFQTIVGMHDAYPMSIMNLASVHDVSSRLPRGYSKLNALRYRANLYMTGPPAFHEDDWTKARIGSGDYHVSCRTTRCKLPNVDPETGIPDRNEPGTTMRKYRIIDEGSKSPCLGMSVTPFGLGEIKVGDEIEVLETGEHYFLY